MDRHESIRNVQQLTSDILGQRVSREKAASIFDAVITVLKLGISDAENDNAYTIRNFGSFRIHDRKARVVKNPQDGTDVNVSEHRVVTFKASPAIKDLVNERTGEV